MDRDLWKGRPPASVGKDLRQRSVTLIGPSHFARLPSMDLDETFSVWSVEEDGHPAATGGGAILVIEGSSSSLVSLPTRGELVIGRGEDAHIRLTDPSKVISRHHARILVSVDSVHISDNDSHNGTFVNGARLAGSRELLAGDAVAVGEATLVLLRRVALGLRRGILSEPQFLLRAREETERSSRYGRTLSILHVDFGETAPQRSALARRLERQIRVQDVVGFAASECHLRFVLPETGHEEAAHLAEALLRSFRSEKAAVRAGIAEYPDHGTTLEALLAAARAAAEQARPGELSSASVLDLVRRVGDQDVVIADPAVKQLYALLGRLGPSAVPVLIYGETGSGKELAARTLHEESPRRNGPLVVLNCAAISESLMESMLFGHRRGAFTGAHTDQRGLCESAHGGTLFLDEIAELSLTAQAKLLRVLETKKVMPLGETRERAVDLRIVAATHEDLQQAVEQKRFRQDLYFRLAAAVIHLPPLRQRMLELPILARLFLQQACKQLGRPPLGIASETMRLLAGYAWPGNVRELRNAMDYAAAITPNGWLVAPDHLPATVNRSSSAPVSAEGQINIGAVQVLHSPPVTFRPIHEEIADLERLRMTEALRAFDGVKSRAAEALQMPLRTFMTKVKHYNLGRAEDV